jgi:hypothetical protein
MGYKPQLIAGAIFRDFSRANRPAHNSDSDVAMAICIGGRRGNDNGDARTTSMDGRRWLIQL